jgi:DNA-binding LacI/PurR family transcriptional regulator
MKYELIAKIIAQRVRSGDYVLGEIPSERELAITHGVSHMTARRAVEKLIQDGQLIRKPNGRLAANRHSSNGADGKVINVAYLTPAWSAMSYSKWHAAIIQEASPQNILIRPVMYVHWQDATVAEALRSFDGVFLVSSTEPIPDLVQDQLAQSQAAVVSVEIDMSRIGLPSICPFPANCVQTVLDHLAALGHTHIACINSQPGCPDVGERISQWRLWCGLRKYPCDLYDSPIEPYEDPFNASYKLAGELLDSGNLKATAVLAVTAPGALGFMRAVHERGLTVGRDIAVCTINDEGLAKYINPTLTSITMTDLSPYITFCLDWMKSESKRWVGPLVMQPTSPPLFIGESTSPPRLPG